MQNKKPVTLQNLLDPKFYRNKESFLVRAFEFYQKEKQVDKDFRMILITTAPLGAGDVLARAVCQSFEGEIDTVQLTKTGFDCIATALRQKMTAVGDEEIWEFLAHFRIRTGVSESSVVDGLKQVCGFANVKFETQCLSNNFGSLLSKLHQAKTTQLNRSSLFEILDAEKVIANDLEYIVFDKKFDAVKEDMFALKYKRSLQNSKTAKEKDYALIESYNKSAADFDLLKEEKKKLIEPLKNRIIVSTIGECVDAYAHRISVQAKAGQWKELFDYYDRPDWDKIIFEHLDRLSGQETALQIELGALAKKQDAFKVDGLQVVCEIQNSIMVAKLKIESQQDCRKIEARYQRALELVTKYHLQSDIVVEYARWLYQQRDGRGALRVIGQLLKEYTLQDAVRVEALGLAARLSQECGQCMRYYLEALEILENLLPVGWTDKEKVAVVEVCTGIGAFFGDHILSNAELQRDGLILLWYMQSWVDKYFVDKDRVIRTSHHTLISIMVDAYKRSRDTLVRAKEQGGIFGLMASPKVLSENVLLCSYLMCDDFEASDEYVKNSLAWYIAKILHDLAGIGMSYISVVGPEIYLFLYEGVWNDCNSLGNKVGVFCENDVDCLKCMTCLNLSEIFLRLHCHHMEVYDRGCYLGCLKTVESGQVVCLDEAWAQTEDAVKVMKLLCERNPDKYLPQYLCALEQSGMILKHKGAFEDAIKVWEEIVCLCEESSLYRKKDVGTLWRHKMESLSMIADLYGTIELQNAAKAIEYFQKFVVAYEECPAERLGKLDWMLCRVFVKMARMYGQLGDMAKRKECLIDKSYEILLRLLHADDPSQWDMWKEWLDTLAVSLEEMERAVLEKSKQDGAEFCAWVNQVANILMQATNEWMCELKKDANLLLPHSLRYIGEKYNADIEGVYICTKKDVEANYFDIVIFLIKVFIRYGKHKNAKALCIQTMGYMQSFGFRAVAKAGVLRESIFLLQCIKLYRPQVEEMTESLDGGDLCG
ncbi:MAG: hypothetical protein FWD76_03250 [Firmicutes bacterium]|nr:hypothetical protein [Bacillota bacterium]